MAIENKKARLNYEILEEFEAGLKLLGSEVKSVRAGDAKLDGAHVIVRGGEAYLVGAHISHYQPGNATKEYDPARNRKLLLNKKELSAILGAEAQKGLTIVPLKVYNKSKHLKVSIAIARGRKEYDKREVLKKRDTEKEMRRSLKNQ